jgi:hypothetical protein
MPSYYFKELLRKSISFAVFFTSFHYLSITAWTSWNFFCRKRILQFNINFEKMILSRSSSDKNQFEDGGEMIAKKNFFDQIKAQRPHIEVSYKTRS